MSGVADGESAVSPATVASLRLLWSRRLSGPIASSPSVAGGRVFVGDWSGWEWALDAATGSLLATAALGTTAAVQCNPPVLGITSTPAVSRGLLFLAGGDDVTAADFTPPGVLGSGIWTSPAVDLAARKVFVTTASATHLEDGHAFSIVRLDLDTLAIEDEWRLDDPMAADDDLDWGSSPTLFTTPDGKRLYVGGGAAPDETDPNLLGTVTALDPSKGQVVWSQTLAGPVIAPVAFANGVVFSTAGRLAFALDAATGRILWSTDTAGACFGGVAVSRGRIYLGDLAGNLYCFSISD